MRISLLISLLLLWQLVAATPPRVNYVEDDAGNFSPEGRWQAGGDGAVFEIRPRAGHNGVFDLVLLSSADMSLSPGVKMGAMDIYRYALQLRCVDARTTRRQDLCQSVQVYI